MPPIFDNSNNPVNWLLNRLHWLEPPNHVRTKSMKVLALGLSRSGTDSLRQALQILGYDHVYHGFDCITNPEVQVSWTTLYDKLYDAPVPSNITPGHSLLTKADFEPLLGNCEAITDVPCAMYATHLIDAYPEAKVILNTRSDLDTWYQSVIATFLKTVQNRWDFWFLSWFSPEMYWIVRSSWRDWKVKWAGDFERNGVWRAKAHNAEIRGWCAGENREILEWRVQDGWGPLCDFLGKDVPKQEFPQGNTGPEFLEKVTAYQKDCIRGAVKNMIKTTVFLAAVGWGTRVGFGSLGNRFKMPDVTQWIG